MATALLSVKKLVAANPCTVDQRSFREEKRENSEVVQPDISLNLNKELKLYCSNHYSDLTVFRLKAKYHYL